MTIFIIIGIIIVAFGVLIYIFYPQIKSLVSSESENPAAFIQTCLEDEIEDTVELLSLQGGSVDPEGYYLYEGNKLKYLCYTNQYYRPCGVQISFLKDHIESEIEREISPVVDTCFEDLKDSFEDIGYEVDIQSGETTVELLPENIVTTLTHKLTLTKGDSEQHDTFRIILDSKLYELVSITDSIIDWESNYGEAEPLLYMGLYDYLEIEKEPQTDETTVYVLTNINTDDKFQFASRSFAFPPGY